LGLRCFLEAQGIYGSVLCAPATRLDESLIRLSVHAGLTDVELDHIVDVCGSARDHVRFADWASTRRQGEGAAIDT
jgi:CAI-1 autoinducer synthase